MNFCLWFFKNRIIRKGKKTRLCLSERNYIIFITNNIFNARLKWIS